MKKDPTEAAGYKDCKGFDQKTVQSCLGFQTVQGPAGLEGLHQIKLSETSLKRGFWGLMKGLRAMTEA
eukprot:4042921-Alexandrium_andersonii.AAC.1